ncbi:uncharacterized protein [Watersipora subatra]|uniref:uncharacterized protein n=1 Tax=Watersipora subatra TaxID=2589382 RepID=UPI00355AF665
MLLNTIVIGFILCVSCVLPSFANVIPCTTESPKTISCLVSEDKDQCSGQSNIRIERSVFSKVINHTGLVFKSPGNDFNSVTISWNAPSPKDLNDTDGYMLKFYRHLDGRSLELCRVLNVTSNESSVNVSDAAVTFNYTIEEIASGDDVLYSYEIYTLPLTSPEPSRFSSDYIQSLSTVTASPQIYDEKAMNLTASNPIPYRIIGRFRRASHYPTLSEDNKFSHYRVLLMNPETGSIIRDFMNKSWISADNILPDGDEYASFTFDAVPPGTYLIQVRPFSWCGTNKHCVSAPIASKYGNLPNFVVKGADYIPTERPNLSISSTNDALVRFKVAPKLHYILFYLLKFHRETPGSEEVNIATKVYPEARNDWYWTNFTLNGNNLLEVFKPDDVIVVEVIPQMALCPVAGLCDIAGECRNCSMSRSLGEIIQSTSPSTQETSTGEQTIWIVAAVLMFIVIVVFGLIAFIFIRRRGRSHQDYSYTPKHFFSKKGSKYMAPNPEDMVGGHKVTICIAHTADLPPEYRNFDSVLRSVLEQYFNAEVILYTGDLSDEKTYRNCDYVVVLYSPNLLITYCFFLRNPEEVPMEQMRDKAVLDLLLTPQPSSTPAVLFVAFENIALRNVNDLVSKNSSLAIFRFPNDLRRFLAELYHKGSNLTLKQSMTYFEEGPLKTPLMDAMSKVTSITDSGLGGEVQEDVRTIRTVDQQDDRIEMAVKPDVPASVPITITPMAYEQQYLQDRQDSSQPSQTPSQPVYENLGVAMPSAPPAHLVVINEENSNSALTGDSADLDPGCRHGSNDLHSVSSSEDSFRCSELTPSMFSSTAQASNRLETIEC